MDCPACGASNPPQARFCLNCGNALATAEGGARREERKVVSVLFADLVGFTARAEQLDPEDVERILRPYHERLRTDLERHGGTVEKFIGDAVMAVFGAPTAHEDDAERAVRAALAIRDWAREQDGVELRVGVNTGEALVNVDARPELGESTVKGDVVNTAARLQSAAPVNGALVGERTYLGTRDVIDFRAVEPVVAKGKAQPIPAWEALDARSRFGVDTRQAGRSQLVGRQEELSALKDALSRARAMREPQLVTLVGVPGMGKSRLVWELFRHADAESDLITWRQGRSLPYGEGVSFWALGEMIKAQAGILESDTADQAASKLEQSVAAVLGEETQSSWVASHLRPLVGVGSTQEIAGERRGEAFAAWRRYVEALADRAPLVLVFEDLHWADEGLLDFIDELADRAAGVPLVLIATARPELLARRPGWGGGKANALTRSLAPLTDEQTAELVHGLLQRPVLAAETQQALLERAGGNPLYAEEFVRLVEDGRAPTELPESVQAIIAARLDALAPENKRLLQQAAVLGKVFWLGGLAEIASASRWAVEEALHVLERREFVRRERRSSVSAETEYAFRHALVRDVAYEQLPRAERAECHRRAARWIESLGRPEDAAEMLAHHYISAIEYARAAGLSIGELVEPARTALAAAGERATGLNSYAAAQRFYSVAIELTAAEDADRPALMLGYGRALYATAEHEAWDVLAEATRELVRSGSPAEAAEAEVMSAELRWYQGDRRRADEHLSRARDLIGTAGRTRIRARVLSEISRYHMLAERSADAVAVGSEAIELARELSLPAIEAHALDNIGVARFYGGDLGGIADLEQSLNIALRADSPEAARSYNNLGTMLFLVGDLRRSWQMRTAAMATDLKYGGVRIARFSEGVVITEAFFSGRWDEYLDRIRQFAADGERLGRNYQELFHLGWAAVVHAARGNDVEASEAAAKAATWAREAGADPQFMIPALASKAFVEYELGQPEEGVRTLEALASAIPQTVQVNDLVLVADRPGATEIVQGMIRRPPLQSKWLAVFNDTVAGRHEQAAQVLDEMAVPPLAALARQRGAEALAAAGRHAEADVLLGRALPVWRQLRAERYIRRAEALLSKSA